MEAEAAYAIEETQVTGEVRAVVPFIFLGGEKDLNKSLKKLLSKRESAVLLFFSSKFVVD